MANLINISTILMKRGNTTAASNYIGPLGELLVDTGLKTIRVQDGSTPGGMATLTTEAQLANAISAIEGITALGNISAILANIQNANISGITSNITTLFANAAGQSVNISTLFGNANAQASAITTLYANAAIQSTNIDTLNLNVTAANSAIVTANTAMKGYVDTVTTAANTTQATQIVNLQNQITGTNAAIVTANTALKGYTDTAISTAINNLIASAPGTLDTLNEIAANLASEASAIGAITSSITSTNANVTAANSAIVTANTAMKGYVDAVTTAWTANAASQATDITTLYSNAATQATSLNTITANLGVLYSGNISTNANIGTIYANLIAQQGNYNTLTANVGAYETWSNANAAGQTTSLNSITANIGSFYTYANLNYGTSSYANANVAAYLVTNPQSGTYSNTNVSAYLTSQNITSANIGAYYAFANANLATQTTNINNITANIGSFYAYANTTYSTGGGGGSGTYSNANVISMLGANSAVFIGNVGNVATVYPIQSNITQVFIGGNTSLTSGNAASPNSTFLMYNAYFAANGAILTRNTTTGVGYISMDSTGIGFGGYTGAVTANTVPTFNQFLRMNGTIGAQFNGAITSLGAVTGVGVTSTGAVAVNSASGITTNQATIPVFPATATTINFGGVATTITLGTTTAATASNVFVANAVGTNNGNLTVRAFGTYNTLSLYGIAGGYNSPPYTNQALTGGSGTGMTANYSSVGGYISTITVSSPGTGYKNGDILTVPNGLGSTVILTNYNANKTGTGLADSTFTMDGNLILPGNVTIPNTASILFANGVNILSTVSVGSTYSNANVSSFLTNFGSNTISTTGNITAGNIIGTHYGNTIGTTATYTGNVAANYFTGNGAALTGISSVGNIYGSSSNVTLVAGSYSSVFDNTGNVSLPGNLKVANTITINNVTTTMSTNGYNNWRGNTYANVDNVSCSVFPNGAPAFSSVSGTLNYFWSSITNLTGGKFFGNTSTGGAVTTANTTIGTNILLGSGGDTVIVTLQDQDLKRAYEIRYMQTVGSGNCAIVVTRIM